MPSNLRNTFIAAILALYGVAPALALPTVTVPPSDSGAYSVQGSNMDGVAGVQLDIDYDAASLATPTVTLGGLAAGAMLAANTSRPGFIKIAIISTRSFSGSGQIVAISFASKTGNGGITSITTSMIDSKGSALAATASSPSTAAAAPASASTAALPFSQPAQQATSPAQPQIASTTLAANAAAGTIPAYLGTVTLPTDQQQRAEPQPATSPKAPVFTGEPAAAKIAEESQPPDKAAADAKTEETPQYVIHKGILDRFRRYSGSKKLSAVAALFDNKIARNIYQEPAILVSSGENSATLTVDIPARITTSPNFAVNGGKLVSFRQDERIRGRWRVEVLPEADSLEVAMTIIAGAEEFEFPLTVAPPLKTTLTLDEKGWNRFLNEAGTATAPRHDLNNDGVRDYRDEFIFVANYLAKKSATAKPDAAPKTPAK